MGMGVGETSLFPNGNILYSSFVKLDTTTEGYCLNAGTGGRVFGIAGAFTHGMAITINGVDVDDAYAGVAGGPAIKIYGEGATKVPLVLGGTVSIGDRLKSDSSGYGVATVTNLDEFGAIARQAGVSGQIIEVDVITGQISAV